MLDKIYIRNLEVFGKHGVLPEENRLGQKFQINAVLFTSTRAAGLKDDLTKKHITKKYEKYRKKGF